MPVAERMDLSSLCCRSKCRGERFISSGQFAGCGWMGWDDSLYCEGLCGRNVRLSAGKSYFASGAAPLAWFLTLPDSQCMSRCSFRGSTGCLKCYWCVKLLWNQSLVTPVLPGSRGGGNCFHSQKLRPHCPQVRYWVGFVNLCLRTKPTSRLHQLLFTTVKMEFILIIKGLINAVDSLLLDLISYFPLHEF